MIRYLQTDDLLLLAEEILGQQPQVRDLGLLASAAARPQTSVFGHEPYPGLADKAAALLVSVALNHALVDGNKRLAFAAALTMCHMNLGRLPDMTQDDAYDMVIGVTEHRCDVADVALRLRRAGITDDDIPQ